MGLFIKLGGKSGKGPVNEPVFCNSIEEFNRICLLRERKEKIKKILEKVNEK